MNSTKLAVVLVFLALIVFVSVLGPIFTIWSLNTLFGLEIPYTFTSWLAVLWLMTVLHGIKMSLKKTD